MTHAREREEEFISLPGTNLIVRVLRLNDIGGNSPRYALNLRNTYSSVEVWDETPSDLHLREKVAALIIETSRLCHDAFAMRDGMVYDSVYTHVAHGSSWFVVSDKAVTAITWQLRKCGGVVQ